MNKNFYRIIFNARRGIRMAVAETAASQGKSASGETGATATQRPRWTLTAFASLIAINSLTGFGLQAQVIADRNAPSNQRPTILQTANGVPQVNIQTPSAAGVSRNVYSQFDVQSKGVILNNSRTETPTQIGGYVQGNPWLANGSARVILNEVNSSAPSQLKGYVEVAGQRAEVIIANPAGIAVNGGGFINASAVTLTTGSVVMNAGNLESYQVRNGTVTFEGAGLDTSTIDYTNILARAVAVNAGIWAKELRVVTGANDINAASVAARIVTSTTAGTGAAPAFALDVAAIGGMYAGKIHLIGTEAGLGIRNAGTIGASTGDVTVSNDGWLSNSGTIQAKQQSQVQATQLTNTVTGAITSGDNTTLAVTTQLDNRGLIDGSTAHLSAQTINNTATGKIYGERISIQANTLNNAPDTIGGQAPTIASRSGNIDLGVGQLFNNEGALIYSSGNLAIAGTLDTNGKATGRTSNITNNSATLEAQGNLDIQTASLKNNYDTLSYQVVVDKVVAGSSGCGADCYTVYDETHYKTEEIPGVNGPGKIISGANLTINASTSALNDRSQILAGSTLDITGASIENKGIDVGLNIEQRGTSHQRRTEKYFSWDFSNFGWKERAWWEVNPYSNDIPDNQTVRLGVSQVSAKPNTGTSVPTASLYTTQPSPTSSYLIVTDPRFTNYRSWLGSDYFTTKLTLDPTVTQKRLGDGFYEQRLINEQVAVLTGRRFLGNFTNDEQQYQALMDAGITYANAFSLRPGITLTAQQVAQLTSDIFWLEETTVTLADGSKQKVITPRVYLMPREGDLAAYGALLGGAEVKLTSSGDINNSGTIQGRDLVSLDAKTINNIGGGIQADTVALKASEDINNLGGTITALNKLEAAAGRNLTVKSSTRSNTNDSGVVKTSNQTVTRLAGLYVTKADGFLLASAGQDINLIGAQVSSAGSASLNAGRDLNLQTVNTSKSFDATLNPENYNRQSQSAEVGSTVQSKGNTTLSAGNNLSARAATVQSGGELSAKAGNNITFEASVASQTDASGRTTEGSSFFASSKSTERQSTSKTQAVGSSFGGNTVTLTSGQDTTIQGSNVLADKDLTIKATGNVSIEAAKNSATSSSYRQTSESGLMSGGGMGFSIGTREQSTDQNDTSTNAAASTVGSVGGNVTISSGKTYTQTGSDVLTPAGNIDITAQTVNITEARETSTSQVDTRFKQEGITVSVSNPVLSAAQSIQNMDKAASQTNSGRMKALAAASAGLAAYSAYTAIDNGMGTMINGKKDQIATGTDSAGKQTSRDSTLIDKAGGFNVNVGIGSSSSESTSRTGSDSARGSSIAAGGNVNIKSTGAGTNSNITIQGANVQAGGETSLQADNKVNLTAAANTTTQTSTNSSSANSVGMGIGTSGWTVNASASKGQGYGDGSDTTYTNTQVKGKAVKITSGGDTNLQGAVVTGSTVKADVGGNLNIETLQDKSTYAETQSSSGFSVSIPIGPGKASGNIHASNTDIKGNYQSANQQSGIQAGGGGFQLAVAGNTDLKGGVIASTDKAIADNKNSLTTGTITTSDVQNHASASATTTGFNVGTSMFTEGAYGLAKGIGANLLDNASQNSSSSGQTRSVVSFGSITITDEVKQQTTGNTASQTIASLNRDTTNANTVAQRQDVQAMKQSVEAERAIKNEAVRQITTLTDEAYRVMFKEVPKFYKVTCPAGVDCTKNPEKTSTTQVMGSAQEVQAELAKAPAGAVLAVNGIDNPLDRAGQLAMQNAEPVRDSSGNEAKPTTIYLMHYVPSNNGLSELLVAGYEKKLAPTLGYSNQDQAYADGLKTLGANTGGDVVSLGHSRGTIVQTNANAILASEGVTKSNLSVQGVGGAVSAEEYTKAAEKVQGPLGNREKITFSYFKNDPIPVGTAGNPGVLSLSEFWKVLSTPNSAHSCYGTGASGCQQVQILSPNAPGGAVQDNSNLVQYIGGKPYDSNMKPLDLKH